MKFCTSKCYLNACYETILIQGWVNGRRASNIIVLQLFDSTFKRFLTPLVQLQALRLSLRAASPLVCYCFLGHVAARFSFFASSFGWSGRTSGWTHASDGEALFFFFYLSVSVSSLLLTLRPDSLLPMTPTCFT